MASASATLLHTPLTLPHASRCAAVCRLAYGSSARAPPRPIPGRRQCLLLLIASSPALLLTSVAPSARAQDIPLFGLRKRLKRVEEAAEVIVEEGEKAVEEGIVAAEREIQEVEEEIVEGASGFRVTGDLFQAAAVVGAEAVGVLVGVSVVNGILGPESQNP